MRELRIFSSQEEAFEKLQEKGTVKLVVGDRQYCLSRFENSLFLSDNACPHNGEHLHKGKVNHLGEIICPWHNFRYRLQDGAECQHRTADLTTYSVVIKPDGIYISVP